MQETLGEPRATDSNVKNLLMSCLKGQQVIIKMEAMKIIHPEKFSELQNSQSRYVPAPRREPPLVAKRAWPSESEIIVNQACGDIPALDSNPGTLGLSRTPPLPRRERLYQGQRKGSSEICYHRQPPSSDEVIVNQYVLHPSTPCEPLECPTCGHMYNFTNKRPRILSCLHSVCEECLQILYESCPKYKFISCPTCKRETVLFTDYGLAALAVNTSILNRLPADALAANPVQWSSEADRSCYQTFRQYCGAACTCHIRNPLSSCTIMAESPPSLQHLLAWESQWDSSCGHSHTGNLSRDVAGAKMCSVPPKEGIRQSRARQGLCQRTRAVASFASLSYLPRFLNVTSYRCQREDGLSIDSSVVVQALEGSCKKFKTWWFSFSILVLEVLCSSPLFPKFILSGTLPTIKRVEVAIILLGLRRRRGRGELGPNQTFTGLVGFLHSPLPHFGCYSSPGVERTPQPACFLSQAVRFHWWKNISGVGG